MRIVAACLFCGALAGCALMQRTPPSRPPDSYLIIFQGKATAILPKAAAIINSVAANANAHPDKVVQLAGPSTKGAPRYSPKLAAERMREVEHALEAAGIDRERIVRAFVPAANLKPDGTGSQRVEIRLMDKPPKAPIAAGLPSSQTAGLTPY
jgi:outer membrane protein OmpA-like peptidoglycan-associated protein